MSLVMPAHSSGMQSSPTCQLSLLCSPVIFSSSNCVQNTIVKVKNARPAKQQQQQQQQQQLLSAFLMSILGCCSCSHNFDCLYCAATVVSWPLGPHAIMPLYQFLQYLWTPPPPPAPNPSLCCCVDLPPPAVEHSMW